MPVTCETRRSRIPVREVIHSSSVSMSDARSALVRMAGGMHLPQPVMAAWVMGIVAANRNRECAGTPGRHPGPRLPGARYLRRFGAVFALSAAAFVGAGSSFL